MSASLRQAEARAVTANERAAGSTARKIRSAKGVEAEFVEQCNAGDGRLDLFEQLHPFAGDRRIIIAKAGHVAAGMREVIDETLSERVSDHDENGRDRVGRAP